MCDILVFCVTKKRKRCDDLYSKKYSYKTVKVDLKVYIIMEMLCKRVLFV